MRDQIVVQGILQVREGSGEQRRSGYETTEVSSDRFTSASRIAEEH
jgi:hypothetical protein